MRAQGSARRPASAQGRGSRTPGAVESLHLKTPSSKCESKLASTEVAHSARQLEADGPPEGEGLDREISHGRVSSRHCEGQPPNHRRTSAVQPEVLRHDNQSRLGGGLRHFHDGPLRSASFFPRKWRPEHPAHGGPNPRRREGPPGALRGQPAIIVKPLDTTSAPSRARPRKSSRRPSGSATPATPMCIPNTTASTTPSTASHAAATAYRGGGPGGHEKGVCGSEYHLQEQKADNCHEWNCANVVARSHPKADERRPDYQRASPDDRAKERADCCGAHKELLSRGGPPGYLPR